MKLIMAELLCVTNILEYLHVVNMEYLNLLHGYLIFGYQGILSCIWNSLNLKGIICTETTPWPNFVSDL